jgi:cell division protein FtsA
MSKNFSCGIDIGTDRIKVLVVEQGSPLPHIIGSGFAESSGVRHGYIHEPEACADSIRSAISSITDATKIKPRRAVVGAGGIGLSSVIAIGSSAVSRADGEITELDISNAMDASKSAIPAGALQNKRIIHQTPLQFRVDGKNIPSSPIGLKGAKLEARTFFVTCMAQHIENLIESVEGAGISVEEIIASPLAASIGILNKAQKAAGVVLANIGSETVSIAVFENGLPTSLEVFPVGSGNVTNDIALGLRIPLEEAESVKRGAITGTNFAQKKLDEIIAARLTDIFELIEAHLKKIGRNGLLPAGIVLTGGGSSVATIDDIAKAALRLPAKIANAIAGPDGKSQIKDASWSVAYGLASEGLLRASRESFFGTETARRARHTISDFFKQFLP